jgi:uncharacterized sulfatase
MENFIWSLLLGICLTSTTQAIENPRPNIIWIVIDDAGADFGCYGDRYARTPNIDRLATQGVRFTNAFTHSPVCAPSRSGLITGIYPTTLGTHHMRSQLVNPPETFTSVLRKAGYYVIWPGKTDFNFAAQDSSNTTSNVNFAPVGSFDSRDDWTNNIPSRQPFFAYINLSQPHESQIRLPADRFAQVTERLKPEDHHDPSAVKVPPYYPDTPEVRQDLSRYYDLLTVIDYRVGDILTKLDNEKLRDNTIVFLFSDHGRGMPRAKRWLYDSGIRIPLIVRWPGQLSAGTVERNLISLIDFAPTMLAVAGIKAPARFQGSAFLPKGRANPTRYVFAARDRMDETFDRIRAVSDGRFKYIRNFFPNLPYSQRIDYNEQNPTMQVWRRLNTEGRLTGPARLFFADSKPKEELYDTAADPHEIKNLAPDPKYRRTLAEMRLVLDRWILDTKDMGSISEREMIKRGIVRDVLSQYEQRK